MVSPRDHRPVVRPRAPREKEPATEPPEDPQAVLTARVRGAVADGARALSTVTAAVTGELPTSERFLEAGRVAHTVAQVTRVASAVERPWIAVGDDLEVEEWEVRAPGDDS